MSSRSDEINIWVPAVVVGFFISVIAAAIWDLCRRRFWSSLGWFCPCILRETGVEPSFSRDSVEQAEDMANRVVERLMLISPAISSMNIYTSEEAPLSRGTSESTISLVSIDSTHEIIEIDTYVETARETIANNHVNVSCSDELRSGQEIVDIDTSLSHVNQNLFPENDSPSIFSEFSLGHFASPSSDAVQFTTTAYLPDDTNMSNVRRLRKAFQKYSPKRLRRWKSSIVYQASMPGDPHALAEILKLVKGCMESENRCTLQLGSWAILYYKDGEVHLHKLKKGDAPVNVEARWQQAKRTGITMHGLYLNGAQIKVATKETSITLRSVGPATQENEELERLEFPTEGFPLDGYLIHAAKVVEVNGCALIVRSEATYIQPPLKKSPVKVLSEAVMDQLQNIILSWKSPRSSTTEFHIITGEDQTDNLVRGSIGKRSTGSALQDMQSELDRKNQVLMEYWRSIVRMEMLDHQQKVLQYLQNFPADSENREYSSESFRGVKMLSLADRMFWQRGLLELNEIIFWNIDCKKYHIVTRVRGGIKFFMGDLRSSLQDFDLAVGLNRGDASVLSERALVKCMLDDFHEAFRDIDEASTINSNLFGNKKLKMRLQQISGHIVEYKNSLHRPYDHGPPFVADSDQPCSYHPLQQHYNVSAIPDLLTGDEWNPGSTQGHMARPGGIAGEEQTSLNAFEICMFDKHDLENAFNLHPSGERRSRSASRPPAPPATERLLIPHTLHIPSERAQEKPLYSQFSPGSRTLLKPSEHTCDFSSGLYTCLSQPTHEQVGRACCQTRSSGVTAGDSLQRLDQNHGAMATLNKEAYLELLAGREWSPNLCMTPSPWARQHGITNSGLHDQYRSFPAEKSMKKTAGQEDIVELVPLHRRNACHTESGRRPKEDTIKTMLKETEQRTVRCLLKDPGTLNTVTDRPSTNFYDTENSKFFGTHYDREFQKWVAEIRVAEGHSVIKKFWLGTFDTEEAAAMAVDKARKILKCGQLERPFNPPCQILNTKYLLEDIPSLMNTLQRQSDDVSAFQGAAKVSYNSEPQFVDLSGPGPSQTDHHHIGFKEVNGSWETNILITAPSPSLDSRDTFKWLHPDRF